MYDYSSRKAFGKRKAAAFFTQSCVKLWFKGQNWITEHFGDCTRVI